MTGPRGGCGWPCRSWSTCMSVAITVAGAVRGFHPFPEHPSFNVNHCLGRGGRESIGKPALRRLPPRAAQVGSFRGRSQRASLRFCQIRQRPHGAGVVEVTVWPVGGVCSMEAHATEASSLETGSQASVSRETGTDRRDLLTSGWRGCRRESPSCPSARYHRDGSVPSTPGRPSGWRRRTGWRSRTVRR